MCKISYLQSFKLSAAAAVTNRILKALHTATISSSSSKTLKKKCTKPAIVICFFSNCDLF